MTDYTTIIDGDILEDTFEEFGHVYDRFTHIIVCDMSGTAIRAVPYTYARNIRRVRESVSVVSLQTHPAFSEYAIKDELLQVISLNPEILYSLIDKQDAIVPALHQELHELEQLEILEESSAESLGNRLILFLKSIKVGNFSGEGVFWLPENYTHEGEDSEDDQGDNEDYEDYIRRVICVHIKCRRLPMAHIMPISSDRLLMMTELIDSLNNYNLDIRHHIAQSHFVPLLKSRWNINEYALKTLMAEEFRCVKNEEHVDCNNCFIFDESHMKISENTVPIEEAHERLRYYVGDYLNDLDMSHSFITGSAITACLIKTSVDHSIESWEERIDILYPKIITEFEPEVLETLRDENITLWNIRAVSETEGVMVKGQKSYSFAIKAGSDVDIAVDNTVSDEQYRQIAQNHFEVIRLYYPYVKLREYTKPKGDWNYIIYTDDPCYIPAFRPVEIYRSSFRNICSHHVGAVRGCYTSRWSTEGNPMFYLTASGVWTSMFHSTPNYHYFAGRKSNPQDIIVKNMQRGVNIADEILSEKITNYIDRKGIKLSHMPFYCGTGVPFSVFAASYEWKDYQEQLRIKHENKARQLQRQRQRQIREENRLLQEQAKQIERTRERELYQASRYHPEYSSPPTFVDPPRLSIRPKHVEAEREAYLASVGIPRVDIPSFTLDSNGVVTNIIPK